MVSRSSSSVTEAAAHSVCGTIRIRLTFSLWTPMTIAARAGWVRRPPAVRRIFASPTRRPNISSGSRRESMHVRMRTPW